MNDQELLNKICYKYLTFDLVQSLIRKKAKKAHPKYRLKQLKNDQINNKLHNYTIHQLLKEILILYIELYSFQIDLAFFPRYKKQNNGYHVMFTAINITTRFGYAYYAKDKEAETIIKFIQDLEKKTVINVLEGDLRNEFTNFKFKKPVKII